MTLPKIRPDKPDKAPAKIIEPDLGSLISWLENRFGEDNTPDDSPDEIRICPICERPFKVPKTSQQITCSPEHEAITDRIQRARENFYRERLSDRHCLITFVNKMIDIKIRCLLLDGEVWFIAKDVCDALELANVSQAVKKIAVNDKNKILFPTSGGLRTMVFFNECGLVQLTLKHRRRKLETEIFKAWMLYDILPALQLMSEYQLTGSSSPPLLPEDTGLTIEPIKITHFNEITVEPDNQE